jgi:hypothetical protein
MRKMIGTAVLVLMVLTLSACDLFGGQETTVTISFETNTEMTLHPLTYEKGETIRLPELHETETMTFSGWFLDEDGTEPATDLGRFEADFTVYAAWTPKTYDVLVDVYEKVNVNHVVLNDVAMFTVDDLGNIHVQKTGENPLAVESGWQEPQLTDRPWLDVDDDNDSYLTAWGLNAFLVSAYGHVYAWGDNTNGQLGTADKVSRGSFVDITARFALPGGVGIRKIAGNQTTTFALSDRGRLYAWGQNHADLMGNTDVLESLVPTDITDVICGDTDHFLVDIVVSDNYAIALTNEHQVLAWGQGVGGLFPAGAVGGALEHAENVTDIVTRSLVGHVTHMAAASDTLVLASDSDRILILGDTPIANSNEAIGITGDAYPFLRDQDGSGVPTITEVLTAGDAVMIQYSDGTLLALGDNTNGLVTHKKGYDAYVARAEQVAAAFKPSSLSMSSSKACAVDDDGGSVWCWGNNSGTSVSRDNDLILTTQYAYVGYAGDQTDYSGIPEDPGSLRSSAGPIFVLSPPNDLVYTPFARPHDVYDVTRYHLGGITMDADLDGILDRLIENVCAIGGGDCDDDDPLVHPGAYEMSKLHEEDLPWVLEVKVGRIEIG